MLSCVTKGSRGLASASGLAAACFLPRAVPLLGAVFAEAVAGLLLTGFALASPAGPSRARVSAPAWRSATTGRGAMPEDPGPQRSRLSGQEELAALAATCSHVSSGQSGAKDLAGNLQFS